MSEEDSSAITGFIYSKYFPYKLRKGEEGVKQ
jgi:hypothetical protein